MTQPAATHEHAGRCYVFDATCVPAPGVPAFGHLWLDWCDTCNRIVLKRAAKGTDKRQYDEVVLYEGDNIDGEGQKGLGL